MPRKAKDMLLLNEYLVLPAVRLIREYSTVEDLKPSKGMMPRRYMSFSLYCLNELIALFEN